VRLNLSHRPHYPILRAFRLRRRLDRVKETESSELQRDSVTKDFDGNVETGFQIATLHGPLCAEPMEGMAFFVERVDIDRVGMGKEDGRPETRQLSLTIDR
jgi:ribosome assembly protein 1